MKAEHIIESHCRLIFNVATPSYEEAWLEGYDTCQQEQDSDLNPYSKNSSEYRYWNDGWWASFYGEEPLFTLSGTVNPHALAKPAQQQYKAHHQINWTKRLFQLSCVLFASVACYILIDEMT